MTESPATRGSLILWWEGVRPTVNFWCGHAYRLAIVLGLLTIIGTPLHRMALKQANISATFPDGSFEVSNSDFDGVEVGDRVPVYRFNPGWRQEIGQAVVTKVEANRVTARHNPTEFLWPLGIQGEITRLEGQFAEINLGANVGLKERERLIVFDGRKKVGALRVQEVRDSTGLARITSQSIKPGLSVTRYSVPNQIVWLEARWVIAAEWAVLFAVFSLFAWSVKSRVPGAFVRAAVEQMKAHARQFPRALWMVWHLAIGSIVVFVVGKIGFWTVTFLMSRLAVRLRQAGVPVPFSIAPFPEDRLIYAYAALGAVYLGWLLYKKSSPVIAAWKGLAFRPPKLVGSPLPRHVVFWALHLVVFFAFTSTLSSVLVGNLAAVAGLGWRGASLNFSGNSEILSSVWYMITNAPRPITASAGFAVARYILWSVTISVCMVGYLHTVVSILWKKPVKNIDFTPTAWLVNGICYGPLLGGVLHHMLPVVQEVDPVLGAGPWLLLQQCSELFLNILYALSLWNLGTMFGVMVDKGVRTSGFYSVVRHPSYTLESLMFFLLLLPGATTWSHWLLCAVFPIKYWIRSERDDVFMTAANPDYTPYRKDVTHKLIPGVY